MKIQDLKAYFKQLFPSNVLELLENTEDFGEQYGFNNFLEKDIKKIGYSVNLTPDIIEEANQLNIDLIITHHNAWDDMFEFRDACLNKLKEYGIIHYFNHMPLDHTDFGPTHTLAKKLGLDLSSKKDICKLEMMSFGLVASYKTPILLSELTKKLEDIMGHTARVWEFGDRKIERVGIIAGSATAPGDLREAYLNNADVFITGEKKIKTLQYAKHIGLNFILGSHTFTELCGVQAFIDLIKIKFPNSTYIELTEDQFE